MGRLSVEAGGWPKLRRRKGEPARSTRHLARERQ